MRKTNKIVIASIVIAIIIILIVAGVLLYLLTDLFKTDQQLFFKYVAQNSQMIEKYLENPNVDNIKNIKQNKYTTNGTITCDLVSNDPQVANQTIPARNFSIKYSVQADTNAKKDSAQMTLKFIDEDLFTLKYAHNDDIYAITSDEVVNKYIGFQNNNLKELAKKYGIEDVTNIPDKIEVQDFSELFKISEDDAQYILQTYMQVINNQISKENYYNSKKTMIQIDDKQVETNCYGVSISEQELKNIMIAICNKLQEDTQTLNLIISKINIIDPQSEITIEDLKEEISDLISEIQDSESFEGIKIEVYEKQGKLVKMLIQTENNEIIAATFETTDNSIRTIYTYENLNNRNQNSDDLITMQNSFKVTSVEFAKQTLEGANNSIIIFTISDNDGTTYKVSLQNKTSEDMQTQSINSNLAINISDSNSTYFTINIDSVTTPSNNVNVEELTDQNSAIINNFTPEYTTSLLQKISNQLQQLLNKKMQIISTVQQNQSNEQNSEAQTSEQTTVL